MAAPPPSPPPPPPYENDPDFLEELAEIRSNVLSGPYPEHLPRIFHRWNSGFQLSVSQLLLRTARPCEAMVLLRPPPPADPSPWLSVLFALHLPAQESHWSSAAAAASDALPMPSWLTPGQNLLLLANPADDDDDDDGHPSPTAWRDVRAACHVAAPESSYPAALVRLHALAARAFRAQPLRPFFHAVLVHRTTLELWTLDRSGMYVAPPRDLRIHHLDALSVVVGLTLLPARDLGLDTVLLPGVSAAGEPILRVSFLEEDRLLLLPPLELRADPIVAPPHGVFNDGLLCYRARASGGGEQQHHHRAGYVVKFKWRSAFRAHEEDFYPRLREARVAGVPRMLLHRRLGSTAELRAGLNHQPYHDLLLPSDTSGPDGDDGFERHSVPSGLRFRERTCVCVVLTPAGLPLSTVFSEPPDRLLIVLRDVVRVHRDMLQNAGVLHGDVSFDNILVVEDEDDEVTTPRGMLIDFDASLDRPVSRPGDNEDSTYIRCNSNDHKVSGTLGYMAVGLFRDQGPHTYRHDLESLFYVLLHAIAQSRNGTMPATSRLVRWSNTYDFESAIEARAEDMATENLARLLSEWDPQFQSCKHLAWDLWRLLFRDGDNLFWGTDTSDQDTNALYDGFLAAFDRAIFRYRGTTSTKPRKQRYIQY